MTIDTLQLPRNLFLADDDIATLRIVRDPELAHVESRLERIETRQRAALARDQVFAVAMICLALLFALGMNGL